MQATCVLLLGNKLPWLELISNALFTAVPQRKLTAYPFLLTWKYFGLAAQTFLKHVLGPSDYL